MSASPSLYLDEDASDPVIKKAIEDTQFDVISTYDEDMEGASDVEQLKFATSEERVLFSFNARDFAQLHEEWHELGKEHYGILLASQQKSSRKRIIQGIKLFLGKFKGRKNYVKDNLFYIPT